MNICENLYATPSAVVAPYFSYQHLHDVVPGEACTNGSSSISGLAFYNGPSYPPSYSGAIFFADYSRDCMWVMSKGASGQPDPSTIATFAVGVGNPVDLKVGPGGDLFYVDLLGGMIRRIQYTGANQSPTAIIAAMPTSGPAPLRSTSTLRSSDPNLGDTLTYAWDLDADGDYDDSTSATPTFNYTEAKSYTVRLRVTDPGGASATTFIVITAGDSPPTATILSPSSLFTWKVGDAISFSGSAMDAKDGSLPASSLSWSLLLHHCPSTCHVHPIQDFPSVATGSFSAPDHEYPSHLELQLTATDSGGLTDTKSLLLEPRTVSLGFQSSPTGLQLVSGGESKTTPFSRTVIVGSLNSVSAPTSQTLALTDYEFGSWSDGGAQTHTVTAPAAPANFIATYGEALPEPWLDQDVGVVSVGGTASATAGTFTVSGSGSDIWYAVDGFHFVYRPLPADGQIVARVVSQSNTNAWAKAGVMIRQNLIAGSAHAMMVVTPGNGTAFQRRLTAGASSATTAGTGVVPRWVKLVRSGTSFTGSTSVDGVTWTVVGSATITMNGPLFVGLAVTSHNNASASTVVFDNISVNTAPTTSLTSPSPSATFTAPATIEIKATASDSEGTVAQVDFLAGTTLLGTDTTSPFGVVWGSVGAGTYSLTARATDNQGAVGTSAPAAVSVGVSALPEPWLDQDVGVVSVGGTASATAGTLTVSGSGSDIWYAVDGFHFVYRPLPADGQIVARVVSQSNTNAWAKAGVMIRQNLIAGSAHAMMVVTPGNGTAFQRRLTAGASSATTAGTGVVPRWVKLVRSGTSFTGSTSVDGVTWTVVGSATITMNGPLFVGLAVTSHNNASASTVVFDNISVN